MEKNNNFKIPNRKNTSPIPIKGFLSLKLSVPFENHPSARGLVKSESKEKKNNIINLETNNNNKENKQISNFNFVLETVEEKIYQNEVFFQKNEKFENLNNNLNYPINKKCNFTKEEHDFDKDITNCIINNERSDVIINKFQEFANVKNSE